MNYSTTDIINAMDFWMNNLCEKNSLTKINNLILKHLECDVRKVDWKEEVREYGSLSDSDYGDWRGMRMSDAHTPHDFDGVKFVKACMKKTDYYSSFAHMTDIELYNHMMNAWVVDFKRAKTPAHFPIR